MSKNWRDDDLDGYEKRHASSRGRKHERRGHRHESKHHLKDLKDMVNSGEDIEIDEIMDDLEGDE